MRLYLPAGAAWVCMEAWTAQGDAGVGGGGETKGAVEGFGRRRPACLPDSVQIHKSDLASWLCANWLLPCASFTLHQQEHSELVNLYSSGTVLYASALELTARCSARRQSLPEAQVQRGRDLKDEEPTSHPPLQYTRQYTPHAFHVTLPLCLLQADLECALLLLRRHTRALPVQQATICLALARVLRARAVEESLSPPPLRLLPQPSGGNGATASSTTPPGAAAATAALIARTRELLLQSLTLAALDGGHPQALMREALLELATSYMPASPPPPAAATAGASPAASDSEAAAVAAAGALRLAHGASTRGSLLQASNHLLTPVAVAQLPEWAVVFAKGQELHFGALQVSVHDSAWDNAVVHGTWWRCH